MAAEEYDQDRTPLLIDLETSERIKSIGDSVIKRTLNEVYNRPGISLTFEDGLALEEDRNSLAQLIVAAGVQKDTAYNIKAGLLEFVPYEELKALAASPESNYITNAAYYFLRKFRPPDPEV